MSQRIRIKLKSHDHNLVDKSAEKIVKTIKSHSVADQQEDLHRSPFDLRPQEIERAVRAFDLQAFARHLQLDLSDDRRTDEAGAPQRCGSRNQIVIIKPI